MDKLVPQLQVVFVVCQTNRIAPMTVIVRFVRLHKFGNSNLCAEVVRF